MSYLVSKIYNVYPVYICFYTRFLNHFTLTQNYLQHQLTHSLSFWQLIYLCWWTVNPRGSLQPSRYVLRYLLKNTNMNRTTEKKKSKFINSSQNEGFISLMHSSILRQIWLNFMAQYLGFFFPALVQFSHFFFGFPTFSAWVPLKRLK
jgi:hypothetical protein